ncbi:MAG TPA: alpha-L-fucosidase [Gemmatimonadaceae bacterium]|nr:alpha-L-fucosidase [Gemmatimonadaceae bacterium]
MTTLDRRSFLQLTALGLAGCSLPRFGVVRAGMQPVNRPVPTPAQLAWHRDELAIFLHFGVNTFTNREWGDGKESPAIFNPTALDARQWARSARAAGFKAMVLTAKHHDGFCLWPTKTTMHSVASSPFRGGRGDVVREFVDASRAEGLRVGLYLSPWDRNHPTYGDSPRYNDVYIEQLTELLTQYGEIAEMWFDGANGEGPNGKRQVYDWPRVWGHVARLQPNAVIFSDAGPGVRWCGNERGTAGDPNWATVDPAKVPYPGADGPGIIAALQHGDRDGTVWRPSEVDVSIRPGWFYHPAEDSRLRSVENLVNLYFTSVGRNGKLLLNVPPTPEGLLHPTDVARLSGMKEALDRLFANDMAARRNRSWRPTGDRTSELVVELGRVGGNGLPESRPANVGIIRLSENIERGQIVAAYRVEAAGDDGAWVPLSRGTTIGYAKLDRVAGNGVRRIRVTVEDSTALPEPIDIRVYAG